MKSEHVFCTSRTEQGVLSIMGSTEPDEGLKRETSNQLTDHKSMLLTISPGFGRLGPG